jgi:pantoate--beta-alanine ligase
LTNLLPAFVNMLVTTTPREAREWTSRISSSRRVAVVPTMGALHEGHLSLVRHAKQFADDVAVTIFVNPTQFAPHEDLARYPRPIEDDLAALRGEGVSMVYHPTVDAIYPRGFSTFIEPPAVAHPLEGVIRPGHYRGVCTVVMKLFQAIPAAVAVFGHKDYQQSLVVKAMVRDLDLPIEIEVAPTVREPDGLAMSSRNRYLSVGERSRALVLSKALQAAHHAFHGGQCDPWTIEQAMLGVLKLGEHDGVDQLDYAVVVDRESLAPLTRDNLQNGTPAIALVAARVGATRLIDNLIL